MKTMSVKKKIFIVIFVVTISLILFVWYKWVELDKIKEEFHMCCVCPVANVKNIQFALASFYAEPENMDHIPSLEYLIEKEGLALDCGSYQHTYTIGGNLDAVKITAALDDNCECYEGERYVEYIRLSEKEHSEDESGWRRDNLSH